MNDFVFPSEEKNENQRLPLWEPITFYDHTESNNYDGPHGEWVISDIKQLDKCRNFNIPVTSGPARLIYISYKNVADPVESLKEIFVSDLKLPELLNELQIVKRGKQRLVFEVPSAIYALLTLQRYCHLYNVNQHLNYEILSVEEDC